MRPRWNEASWLDVCYGEHSIWVVVMKANNTRKDGDYRYCGSPCLTWEEAYEVMKDHTIFDNNITLSRMVEDGAYYDEINPNTGEVVAEYIIKKVGAF